MRSRASMSWSRRALLQSLAVGAGAVGLPGLATLHIDDDQRPRGPSIDQYIADKLGRVVTPEWPSLELVSQEDDKYVSFLPDGTCTPAIDSPWTASTEISQGHMTFETNFGLPEYGGGPMSGYLA